MKTGLLPCACLLLILYGCRPSGNNLVDYTGFSERKVVLTGIAGPSYKQNDTLGVVTMQLPGRLDTFYQWHRISDCLPCGNIQYRLRTKPMINLQKAGFTGP